MYFRSDDCRGAEGRLGSSLRLVNWRISAAGVRVGLPHGERSGGRGGYDAGCISDLTIVAELKAGSEAAYAWLIGEFQRPVYGLVYRMVSDPADAADTTQDVFLKVFRGMKHFHGESSLKTWIYRIALHEAANRKRWWFRHKAQETPIEPSASEGAVGYEAMQNALTDRS